MPERLGTRVALVVGLALALPLAYPLNAGLTPDSYAEPIRVVPSLGVAAALALIWPRRRNEVLGAVALAPFLVLPVTTDRPLPVIVAIAAAGTAQVAIVVFGLERLLGRPVEIRRPSQAVTLLVLALIAAAVGATIAELPPALLEDGATPTDTRWVSWSSSFFIETAICVPAALAFRVPAVRLGTRAGRLEALAALACLAGVLVVAATVDFVAAFTVAPVAVWFGVRFGSRLAAPAVAISTVVITALAVRGSGEIQGRLPTAGWAAFAMALVASVVVTTALAQQATDDRSHLSTTLSAITDVVALADGDGTIIESWGTAPTTIPRSDLAEVVAHGSPEEGRRSFTTADGRTMEHRWVPATSERSVHVIRDVTTRHLLWASQRQRRLDIDRTRRAEQQAIGVRLHDGPIQELTVLLLNLDDLRSELDDDTGLVKLEKELATAIADLRNLVDLLVPVDVTPGHLAGSLLELATKLLDPHALVSIDETEWVPPGSAVREALYLVGKEAVANAAFHAQPSEVRIVLRTDGSTSELSVADDGPGMTTPSDDRRHLGLELMRARMRAVGGSLQLRRGPLGGLEVVARVPSATTAIDLDQAGRRSGITIDLSDPPAAGTQGRGAPSTFAS